MCLMENHSEAGACCLLGNAPVQACDVTGLETSLADEQRLSMEHAPIPNFMLLRDESVPALTSGRDLTWLAEVGSACSSLA